MRTKSLLVEIFQLAENGGLSEIEQKEILSAINAYGRSLAPGTFQERFKAIRIGTRKLLEQIEKCMDTGTDDTKVWFNTMEKMIKQENELPEGASLGDSNETLSFIKSLTKEYYNFSDVEKLIGVTRQSIKTWADAGKYNIKTTTRGERQVLTKANLIEFYRAYFEKDGYGF